jgi:hypothetical protein
MFIPDPTALDEGARLLREMRFRFRSPEGELIIPHVRIEAKASKSTFRVPRRKVRRYVPLRRSHHWQYRQANKRRFSFQIRGIVQMVAQTRGHLNLKLWRDPANVFILEGECLDCGMTLWVGPGWWRARPGTLKFRGRCFIDSCTSPQPIRKVERRPALPPFSRLLAGRP